MKGNLEVRLQRILANIGDIAALQRILDALKLLRRDTPLAEEHLAKKFAEEHYDLSADNEREEGRILNNLQIEAKTYYQFFNEIKIVTKNYQDRPGRHGYKDLMYKLAKPREEAEKIIRNYIKSLPAVNNILDIVANANNNSNT